MDVQEVSAQFIFDDQKLIIQSVSTYLLRSYKRPTKRRVPRERGNKECDCNKESVKPKPLYCLTCS
jgi:hypothetical protein